MFSLGLLVLKLAGRRGLACWDRATAIWLISSGGSQVLRSGHSHYEALARAADGLPHPAEAGAQGGRER